MAISLLKAYFVVHFCYHSNGKILKKMPKSYISVILLVNQKEIGEKHVSVFGSRGVTGST